MFYNEGNESNKFNIQWTYNICEGNLLQAAKKFKDYNFVYDIGGNNNGFSEVIVNTSNSCIYYLLLKYVSYEPNLSFKININNIENNNVYYVDFSSQWSINTPLTYTIPLFLNNGKNILKFYGNGNNNAPYLGEFKVATPPITNNLSMGILENSAYIDSNTKFVNAIGGPKDGAVSVTVNIIDRGMYNLVFSYICDMASRTFKIDINGIDSNNIYTVLSTTGFELNGVQNFTIPISLNSGNNTIKFHGDGMSYGPSLGSIFIKSIGSSATSIFASSKTYKVSTGTLGNGANINKNNMITQIGGLVDGYYIVKVPVDVLGDYLIKLTYSNGMKPLKIDINDIETGTIYNLSKKSGTFSVELPLVAGTNQLKFHGNGDDYAPDLGSFTVELSKDNSSTTFTGLVSNNARILPSGIVTGLGGFDDGMYSIAYITKQAGWYDLYVTVDTSKGTFLILDINMDYNELFYKIPKADTATVYILSLFLEEGINNIAFHGDNLNNAPDILNLEIKLRKAIKDNIYKFIDGILENGAMVNFSKTLVENLGGIDNGSVTLNVTVNNAALYDLNIIYIGEAISSPLKIDIIFNKQINTSTICTLPASSLNGFNQLQSFKLTLPLVKGINNIKFYGNGINSVPNLKEVRISEALIKDSNFFSKTYELSKADLFFGAKIDKSVEGFITGIGGSRNGRAIIFVNVPKASEYEIKINYLTIKDNVKISIGVDNISGDNLILCPKTNSLKKVDSKTISITTFLNENSSLTFSGTKDSKDLFLGSCTITKVALSLKNPIKITSIKLFNGARKYKGEDFINLIGGSKNGGVELLVDAFKIGVYDLGFKYICASNERILNVKINNEIGNKYKMPLTKNWEILSAETFTIPLFLIAPNNTITLEGDGYNFAPIIGKFNFVKSTNMSVITYNTSTGILKNGAKINSYGLVTNIGGTKKGEVSIKVYVEQTGKYDLSIEYKPINQKPNLEIMIDNNRYSVEIEKQVKKWSLTDMPTLKSRVDLKNGENIITFRAAYTVYYSDFLGEFTLMNIDNFNNSVKKLPKDSYDLTKGKLENGATILGDFVEITGGKNNESVTITVNVEATDRYIMRLYYKAIDDSTLMFDINGEETGNIYFIPKTSCIIDNYEFEINLKKGDNLIKFYGNKYWLTPNLNYISIELFK